MHLPDGVVQQDIALIGYGISFLLYYLSGSNKELNVAIIPKLSLITSVLFVASLINLPVGMTTVHFSFVGLAGILLGPLSFLAILVALFLQLILFSHGGYSTLGVNTFNFALGALVAYYLFNLYKRFEPTRFVVAGFAFLAGTAAMLITVISASFILYLSDYPANVVISLATVHLPIFLGEGLITALLVIALKNVKRGYIYEK